MQSFKEQKNSMWLDTRIMNVKSLQLTISEAVKEEVGGSDIKQRRNVEGDKEKEKCKRKTKKKE